MISQFCKQLILISIFMTCCVFFATANSVEKIDMEIINGKIVLFGNELKTKHDVKITSPPDENDTVINTKTSPNNNSIILVIGFILESHIEWEFWFYNIEKQKAPKRINVNTSSGSNVRVKWHSNDVFEIAWGGFGWRQSRFFDAKNLDNNFLVDDCVLYDDTYDVYVAVKKAKIEIGPGFCKRRFNKEFFDIELEPNTSALDVIKDIQIENTSLVVFVKKERGVLEKKVFKPFILKKKHKLGVDSGGY